MSYCRFGYDSDVYMYPHAGGYIECCLCCLPDRNGVRHAKNLVFDKRSEAIDHLREHIKEGDMVPNYAVERILVEMAKEGDKVEPI